VASVRSWRALPVPGPTQEWQQGVLFDPFAVGDRPLLREAALRRWSCRAGSSRRAAITRNVAQVKPESKNRPLLTVRCVGCFGRFPFDSRPFEPNSSAPSPRLGCQHGTPDEGADHDQVDAFPEAVRGRAAPALPISSSFRQLHREARSPACWLRDTVSSRRRDF
jgi:hypothetical protein